MHSCANTGSCTLLDSSRPAPGSSPRTSGTSAMQQRRWLSWDLDGATEFPGSRLPRKAGRVPASPAEEPKVANKDQ